MAAEMIQKTPWSGHHDGRAFFDVLNLAVDGLSAIDGYSADAAFVFQEFMQFIGNLKTQLTGGAEHNGL